jgi:UDP-N-acetylmuramoyl-L-alanyl-D-glutamate--2,6-diaminopimelate ligase
MRLHIMRDPRAGLATDAAGGGLGVFCAVGRWRSRQAVLEAWRRGADRILVDPALYRELASEVPATTLRRVTDVRRAYARLTALEAGSPSRVLKVVGITGTNGKSTVAAWLHWVLKQTGHAAGLIGTVSVDTGCRVEPAGLTTPDAYDIARYLAAMRSAGLRHAVMEASSHGLDQRRTDGVRFQVGVFLNLAADHLDYHASPDAYRGAKRRLFETLPRDATAVINADDPNGAEMAAATRAHVVRYGTAARASVRGHWVDEPAGILTVETLGFQARGILPGLGAHRLSNALAVLASALALGVRPEAAWEALLRFPGLWRRLQVMAGPRPVPVVDDCAHNPANLGAALHAAGTLVREEGRLHVLYAIRGSRGALVNALNAAALADRAGPAIRLTVTRAEDLAGPGDVVQPEEAEAFRNVLESRGVPWRMTATVREAIGRIQADLARGDAVLLMGAHAMDRAAEVWRELERPLRSSWAAGTVLPSPLSRRRRIDGLAYCQKSSDTL